MNTEQQLTRDLPSHYRDELVDRLTAYDPHNISTAEQAQLLGDQSTTVTLQTLMMLNRPDLRSRSKAVVDVEERLGLSRRTTRAASRSVSRRRRRRGNTAAAAADAGSDDNAPRWFKSGGGFMTASHKGRCCFDPKCISVNTPGAGNPSTDGVRKQVGGMGFGQSTSDRGLRPIKRRRGRRAAASDADDPGLTFGVKQGARRRPPGAPMLSTGSRYGPSDWLSSELKKGSMGHGISVHAAHGTDRSRCTPGPRYNSNKSIPGTCHFGGTMRFSTMNRFGNDANSFMPPSQSPGPAYDPYRGSRSHPQTEKAPPGCKSAGRGDVGSIYELTQNICTPGPVHNPIDAVKFLHPAPGFSFAAGPAPAAGSGIALGASSVSVDPSAVATHTVGGQTSRMSAASSLRTRNPKQKHKQKHDKMMTDAWHTIRHSARDVTSGHGHRPLEYL